MKHFLNPELGAPNVMTVAVDAEIVAEFATVGSPASADEEFAEFRPPWSSDISWISATSPAAFARFENAFRNLGVAAHVAPYLDLDKEVRLYAGFLVVRSECQAPNFHVDWERTDNEAFTLITPVSANTADFGLLYRKLGGDIAEYDYKRGEAIILGDHFVHSTKPGRSDEAVVLLSFTFGTDKMQHWDKILRTAGHQSRLVRRPDGQLISIDQEVSRGYLPANSE